MKRMMSFMELGVLEKDARALIRDKSICEYFEKCLELGIKATNASNYVVMNILTYLNKSGKEINDIYLTPEYLKEIDELLESKKISSSQGKELIVRVSDDEKSPSVLVKELGMEQISDENTIRELVNSVLDENANLVETYKSGKTNILGALVGKTLQKSGGKANPAIVNKVINEEILKR